MAHQYYGSAEWLADCEREEAEEQEAANIDRAKRDAQWKHEEAEHRKAEANYGIVTIRAPYTGAVVRRYKAF